VKILTTLSRPTAGRASIVGRDVVREPQRVRRVIGLVAQKSAVDLVSPPLDGAYMVNYLKGGQMLN
jgi:ABC-2 type transport system ATP-binding protein